MYIALTRKRVIVAGVLFVLALGASRWVVIVQWDGRFDVPVTIYRDGRVLGASEIRRVSYCPCSTAGMWEERELPVPASLLKEAEPARQGFNARIPCSGTRSWLGFDLRYLQSRTMYVEIELADGRVVKLSCPLTHRYHNPEIRIDVGDGK